MTVGVGFHDTKHCAVRANKLLYQARIVLNRVCIDIDPRTALAGCLFGSFEHRKNMLVSLYAGLVYTYDQILRFTPS